MGYTMEKASSAEKQRKLDNALVKVFDRKNRSALSDAARYLASLYLFAHGDERFSDVLDSLKVEVTYNTTNDGFTESSEYVCASSTAPHFFDEYLKLRSNELSHSLAISADGDFTTVSVKVWSKLYPNADLSKKSDAAKIACFAIFQGLSMVVEPAARYQMSQTDMTWKTINTKTPIVLVMDAIVNGRVTACPVCGTPVYLVARKNPTPFCGVAHNNTYHRRAKRLIIDGVSVDDVCNEYPLIPRDTVKSWT